MAQKFYIANETSKFNEGNILVGNGAEAPDGFVIVGDEFSNVWYPTEEKATALVEITEEQYKELYVLLEAYNDEASDWEEVDARYNQLIAEIL